MVPRNAKLEVQKDLDLHFRKWRFFDQLHFLADSFTSRHAASNSDIETIDGDESHGNTAASSVHLPVKRRG